uniref:putative glycoside hydrolase n=1 Tax=uncultured Sphingomonas sp. TaxID=158754 RepID=UPI0025FCCC70|nr:putative glycoside hydrolase [uncultured Sphingomonas sp.]
MTISGPAADVSRQLNNAFALAIDWRIDSPPTGRVVLSFGNKALDITDKVRTAAPGRVATAQFPLRCFAGPGSDFTKIGYPFTLRTEGALGLTLSRVRLEPITSGDSCPPQAP